jgi:ribonuclease T2
MRRPTAHSLGAPAAILAAILPAILAAAILAGCEPAAEFDHYVLALSWQPAFCERNAEKPECQALDAGDFAASNPVLHGLWPSARDGDHPAYCGIAAAARDADEARQWCELPAPGADRQTQAQIERLMPGSESCLDRHEWLKHGTCSGLAADAYFEVSARLTEDFQATRLADLLRRNVGKEIPLPALIEGFEAEFGADSAAALIVTCRSSGGRTHLAEIRLALRLDSIDKPLSGNSLFLEAPKLEGGCPGRVLIDRAGPG